MASKLEGRIETSRPEEEGSTHLVTSSEHKASDNNKGSSGGKAKEMSLRQPFDELIKIKQISIITVTVKNVKLLLITIIREQLGSMAQHVQIMKRLAY